MWRVTERALWAWERFGELPAVAVVAAAWAIGGLAVLAVGDALAAVVAGALLVLVILYCLARPRGGWDVFATAAIPSCGTILLHDLLGAPRWVFFVLVPLSLLILWDDEPSGINARAS